MRHGAARLTALEFSSERSEASKPKIKTPGSSWPAASPCCTLSACVQIVANCPQVGDRKI